MAERHKKLYKTMRLLAYGVTVAPSSPLFVLGIAAVQTQLARRRRIASRPLFPPAANPEAATLDAQIIPDQYIVVFNEAHLPRTPEGESLSAELMANAVIRLLRRRSPLYLSKRAGLFRHAFTNRADALEKGPAHRLYRAGPLSCTSSTSSRPRCGA